MKRIGGNIVQLMASDDNIDLAVRESMKRRNKNNELFLRAILFMLDYHNNVAGIRRILLTGDWHIAGYRTFTRVEHGKRRVIDWNPSFRDNVIQHAIAQTVGERLTRTFITDTYSGIKHRGMSYGLKRMKQFLTEYSFDSPLYVCKLDIRHFYPNIDVSMLKSMLRRRVKDWVVLKLLDSLIDSHPAGLPIGNYLSQLLANFYLNEVDHHMKETAGASHYVRYCDDIVILNGAKLFLKGVLDVLKSRLSLIGLSVKGNAQIFPVERHGIDFMGYLFRRGGVLLRRRIERRFRQTAYMFKQSPSLHNALSLSSYYGWTKSLTRGRVLWNSVVGRSIHECMEIAA